MHTDLNCIHVHTSNKLFLERKKYVYKSQIKYIITTEFEFEIMTLYFANFPVLLLFAGVSTLVFLLSTYPKV